MEITTQNVEKEIITVEVIEQKVANFPFEKLTTQGKLKLEEDIIFQYSKPSIEGYKLNITLDKKGGLRVNFGCTVIREDEIQSMVNQLKDPNINISTKKGLRYKNGKAIREEIVDETSTYYVTKKNNSNYSAYLKSDVIKEEYKEDKNILKNSNCYWGNNYSRIDCYELKGTRINVPKSRTESIIHYVHDCFTNINQLLGK